MTSTLSAADTLDLVARLLRDTERIDALYTILTPLEDSCHDFIETHLLQSAYPEKHNIQTRIQRTLEHLEFLSFFPHLADKEIVCLVGFHRRERVALIGQLADVPAILAHNESVPTFFSAAGIPSTLISSHGCRLAEDGISLPRMLDSIAEHSIELRRLLSAISMGLPGLPPKMVLVDCPEFALSDSRFFLPAVRLADRILLSLCAKNIQLELECLHELKHCKSKAQIHVLTDPRHPTPPALSSFPDLDIHVWTQVNDIPISEPAKPCIPFDFLHGLLACMLALPAWLAKEDARVSENIFSLSSDITMLNSGLKEIEKGLKDQRENLRSEQQAHAVTRRCLDQCIENIWRQAREVEQALWAATGTWQETHLSSTYMRKTRRVFEDREQCFLHFLQSGYTQHARTLGKEMAESGYPNPFVLDLYLAEATSSPLPRSALENLVRCTEPDTFAARAIIHFRDHLGIAPETAGVLADKLCCVSHEEHYVHGMWLMREGRKEEALRVLRMALKGGSEQAGEVLLDHCPDSDTKSLAFLAKHHIPAANFRLGKQLIASRDKKEIDQGWTNIKIAAALGSLDAVRKVADKEYFFAKSIRTRLAKEENSSPQSDMERRAQALENARSLYALLLSKDFKDDDLLLNYGELLYYDDRFNEAFQVLGNCPHPRASILRGRMYEYGNGVSRNLTMAKTCYQYAIDHGIEQARKYLERSEKKIATEERKKSYSRSSSYSGESKTTSNSYSSSSWCFITTATCLALGKDDNCDVLNDLRAFRDSYLTTTAEGVELIEEYYNISPKIVMAINQRKNRITIYNTLWNEYLQKCHKYILAGKHEEAKYIYINMVHMLYIELISAKDRNNDVIAQAM